MPKNFDHFPCCSVTHSNHVLCVQLLLDFAIVDFHGTTFLNANHLRGGYLDSFFPAFWLPVQVSVGLRI